MKKFFVTVAVLIALVCLAACAGTPGNNTPSEATAEATAEADPVEETQAPEATPELTSEPTAEPTPSRKIMNVVYDKEVEADYSQRGEYGDPKAIVDEDETTRWSGFDLQRPNWRTDLHHEITIDLGGRYELSDFSITWETLTGYYKILVTEDGSEWKEVYEFYDVYTKPTMLLDESTFPKDTFATKIMITVDFPEDEEFSDYPYCSIYDFVCYGYEPETAE
ncbi:MAG: discoidin domain-containing protein [Clostridia bacterium]|nr:discoidin domain-containing protein [Clostridia bacterium]